MIIIKPDKNGISQAITILRGGGVIVYPTDTAYALGGIFNLAKVTKKILRIKKRKDEKFTLVASDFSQVQKFFKLNSKEKKLGKKYWPGPLSIVVSKRFAVRVPKNKIAQKLALEVGRPLIATSANISGSQTLYDSEDIIRQFKNKKNQPDLILNIGRLPKIKTSTIVEVFKKEIKIIRKGSVKLTSDNSRS